MKLRSSRTCLNVRVGDHHVAECILHISRDDLSWFNDQTYNQQRCQELFSLLSKSILPRMFYDEVEDSHDQRKLAEGGEKEEEMIKRPPKLLGLGGKPLEVIGERNTKQKQQQQQQQQEAGVNSRKRKQPRGGVGKAALAAVRKAQAEKNLLEGKRRNETGIYYAFGDSIQLTYRLIEAPKEKPLATLVFNRNDTKNSNRNKPHNDDNLQEEEFGGKNDGSFRQLVKLSKRIIIWCYPYDPDHPNEPDPDGGMPRPEMIPISELFREPQPQPSREDG